MRNRFSVLQPYVCYILFFTTNIVHRSALALVHTNLFVRRHDHRQHTQHVIRALPEISETDASLAAWTLAFSSTHIGLSAIRESLIQSFGRAADSAKLVGNKNWRLPAGEFWPGDNIGKDQIFPTAEIAGRQLYRAFYTLISFITLGSALNVYVSRSSNTAAGAGYGMHLDQVINEHPLAVMTAMAANAASLLSLANASPLSLVPSFETTTILADGNNEDDLASSGRRSTVFQVNRNDSLKFQVRGLTRITRHPLILPVVPWGIANAIVLGGSLADWIFFGGLSLYAICGCLAQDLRVSRQEGSVGTTFEAIGDDKSSLQQFFYSTSFVPFGAILDGRQSIGDVVREIPWLLAVLVALPVGIFIEKKMLEWLLMS